MSSHSADGKQTDDVVARSRDDPVADEANRADAGLSESDRERPGAVAPIGKDTAAARARRDIEVPVEALGVNAAGQYRSAL
jgi:hypothetical protein